MGGDNPPPRWQEAMRRAIRDPLTLCQTLQLPVSLVEEATRAARDFPLFAPWEYVARMRQGDVADPLLRQVLPASGELRTSPDFSSDPVGDGHAALGPGLLQKYHGRALIVTTGACAVHCRYCFRRHFPYGEASLTSQVEGELLQRIASDRSLEEVLLSGGDPLTLPDSRLATLASRLADIPHLRRLRIHTRLPIVIPQRVTSSLIDWLRGTRLTPVVVIHANHPQEIDPSVRQSLTRLVDAGIPVLNQTVLLRGINDQAEVLIELSRQLVDLRVFPYYLHQLDRVRGAEEFETSVERGHEIIERMRAVLPGYAVPHYVREMVGEPSKTPLT